MENILNIISNLKIYVISVTIVILLIFFVIYHKKVLELFNKIRIKKIFKIIFNIPYGKKKTNGEVKIKKVIMTGTDITEISGNVSIEESKFIDSSIGKIKGN